MRKKVNILVTGGAGYIGGHFVNKAKDLPDINIFVVDNFSQRSSNVFNQDNVKYFDLDILDAAALRRVFKENAIDIVAHFAALANVPDSVVNPRGYYENNVVGGLNLLNAMLDNGVDKIINSSSASVFGEPIDEEIDEDHPKNPTNPYGYTKLVFENILKDYHKAYGLKSISFRYLCASGCDESGLVGEYHNPESHVIPILIKTVLGERDEFFVFGDDFPTKDGSGIRDYVHVNDLAAAHLLAMDKLMNGEQICEFYNLGINQGFSVLELINVAEKVSGRKVKYSIKSRREGDPSKLIANSTKAQRELGWKPKYLTIEEIFSSAFDFFKKQK